jgi:hypothetical protein
LFAHFLHTTQGSLGKLIFDVHEVINEAMMDLNLMGMNPMGLPPLGLGGMQPQVMPPQGLSMDLGGPWKGMGLGGLEQPDLALQVLAQTFRQKTHLLHFCLCSIVG